MAKKCLCRTSLNDNYDILLLVTHAMAKDPYTEITPLTIEAKLIEQEVNQLVFSISFLSYDYTSYDDDGEVQMEGSAGDLGIGTPDFKIPEEIDNQPDLEIDGLQFTQTWDYTNSANRHFNGSLTVSVDEEYEHVVSYHFKETCQHITFLKSESRDKQGRLKAKVTDYSCWSVSKIFFSLSK